jgi:transcriptional regulator with XRE-family HTH domain
VHKSISEEAGRALRQARAQRGLTLREVGALSNGTFKASAVAGYERGERSITLQRFCELASLYGIRPEHLLADIVRAREEGPPTMVVDLARLERLGDQERRLVEGFVDEILTLRGEEPAETISLRVGDLEILATASGRPAQELLQLLGPALRRQG